MATKMANSSRPPGCHQEMLQSHVLPAPSLPWSPCSVLTAVSGVGPVGTPSRLGPLLLSSELGSPCLLSRHHTVLSPVCVPVSRQYPGVPGTVHRLSLPKALLPAPTPLPTVPSSSALPPRRGCPGSLPALSHSGLPAHHTEMPQGPRERLCILRLLHIPAQVATQR